MIPFLGIGLFIAFSWTLSEKRKDVDWFFVFKALLLQFVIAFVFLKVPLLSLLFAKLNNVVLVLQEVTEKASTVLFGYLAGGATPFAIVYPENNFIVVTRVLPLILVVNALSAVLFHWRILPAIIHVFALALKKSLGISGPLGFGSAASVFFGTIETPLLIRPYLEKLDRADFFALISCSMATISGTVMVLYASVLSKVIPNPMMHLLIASMINVPGALLIARILIPKNNSNYLSDNLSDKVKFESPYEGTMDALFKGIAEGMNMIFGILGVILVFFALIYLFNRGLSFLSPDLSLELILGMILRPFMWLIGIPWSESLFPAKLMGTKIIFNEFIAFMELAKAQVILSEKSRLILLYALCGFANFSSAGIIIGGLTTLFPKRRQELASLTFKSLISGNLATLMTATIVGLIIF